MRYGVPDHLPAASMLRSTAVRKIPVTILALAALSTAALASPMSTTGIVKKVNPKTDSITLSDGNVYALSEKVEAETVKVGTKVSVTFEMKKHKRIADSVTPVK
jgi:Cu/Ag efflux protein CusF